MKILVLGAAGTFGALFTREALEKGHTVTAFVRSKASVRLNHPGLTLVEGDAKDPHAIVQAARGQDIVVSAIGPNHGQQEPVSIMQETARSIVDGVREAAVPRLAVVGGAGSLEVSPGHRLVDSPQFPPEYRPLALAHAEAFEIIKTFRGDWTYFSPAADFFQGPKTGTYRLGGDTLLCDERGMSRISYADGALALLNVIEAGTHRKARFTAAY